MSYPIESLRRIPTGTSCLSLSLLVSLFAPLALLAQTASPAAERKAESKVVSLSPFEVTAENDNGYVAGNTLGATRVNSLIRDLPLQINVVTEDMISDFGAYDLDQVIDHLPGVNREFNEFSPTYSIRGFSSAAAMRNGVRTLFAPDTNSIARVEVIKGPAALLYGTSGPGGVINYITRQPSSQTQAKLSTGFGTNGYLRSSLSVGGPTPLGDGKKLSYLVDAVWYEQDHGERQQSLRRYSLAPVLRWTPFEDTSITLRATKQHDDYISNGGLLLLPSKSEIRTSTSTPRLPHWAVELGRDYNIHSPSSWVDVDANILEVEIKQRLGQSFDLRANLSSHRRPRSSIREGGSNFLDTGVNVAVPNLPENLAPGSPDSLSGRAPAYDPIARTGWRTISIIPDDRVERRRNLQVDLVGRLSTGSLDHTLLVGVERNLENRSTQGHSWFKVVNNRIVGLGTFTYAPFDPASAAGKDLWVELNQPALADLPISSLGNTFTNNSSIYSSLTTKFMQERGLVLIGGRYDAVKGGTSSLPVDRITGALGTAVENQGNVSRFTPQAGISFRIAEPITGYVMVSESVNPRIAFQPLRTLTVEERVINAYTNAGVTMPDLDTLPWGELLAPEYGTSLEFGFKWELFERRLQGTVAVFDIERRNVRTNVEGSPLADAGVNFRDIMGQTRAHGIDLDVAFSPTRNLQIVGGMLFNETEVLFSNAKDDIGKRIGNAPKWSGNLTSRYSVSSGALKGAAFGASFNYVGARRESDGNARWAELWQRYDVFASYQRKFGDYPVTFAVNVKNLFDSTFRVDRDTFAAGREFRFTTTFHLK